MASIPLSLARWVARGAPETEPPPVDAGDGSRACLEATLETCWEQRLGHACLAALALDDRPRPPGLEEFVSRQRVRLISRYARHWRLHRRIAAALSSREIPALFPKGLGIAADVYPQPWLRDTGDVDVLVPPDRYAGALRTLLEMGATPLEPWPDLPSDELADYVQLYRQVRLRARDGIVIELHARLFNAGLPDEEEILWSHPRRVPSSPLALPPLEHHFVWLCQHFHVHLFEKLGWLLDVSRFLTRHGEEIGWSQVDRVARGRGASFAVSETLRKIRQIEPDHRRFAAPARAFPLEGWDRMKTEVVRWTLATGENPLCGPAHYLFFGPTLAKRGRFLRRILFPPRRWLGEGTSFPIARAHLARIRGASRRARLRPRLGGPETRS